MSIISAFVKGAVYPIFLFVFLPFKKHKYLFSILCLVVSSALMIYWASINYTYVNPLADAEYHRNLLIHNPFDFLVMYFKTLFYNLTFYIRSCIGYLGLLDVKFNSLVYVVYFILFVSMFFVLPEKKITRGQKWVSILAVVIFTTFLHLMYYINWTSPMDAKITGIQGRYFIPILPFLFIIFTQKSEYFSEKFRINYKVFLSAAVFFLLIYVSVVLKIYYNL